MPMQIRRTTTANPPTNLDEGQLAVQMATPDRPALWVGVPAAIDASGRRLINPAGGGVTIAATAPATPATGDQWWDTVSAQMYVWDGDQWVVVVNQPGPTGPEGPQGIQGVPGPQGDPGTVPEVPGAGAYLRVTGNWVPTTVNSTFRTAILNMPAANTWYDAQTMTLDAAGVWLVTGTATLTNTAAGQPMAAIRDTANFYASTAGTLYGGDYVGLSLTAIVTNPATAVRLAVRANMAATQALFNFTTAGRDTTMAAVRVG